MPLLRITVLLLLLLVFSSGSPTQNLPAERSSEEHRTVIKGALKRDLPG